MDKPTRREIISIVVDALYPQSIVGDLYREPNPMRDSSGAVDLRERLAALPRADALGRLSTIDQELIETTIDEIVAAGLATRSKMHPRILQITGTGSQVAEFLRNL